MTGRSCPGSSGSLLATLIVAFPRVLPPGGLDGGGQGTAARAG